VKASDRYDSLFQAYGDFYHVDWRLLKCQAAQESLFNPDAHSAAGAKGLTQFMDPTFAEWAAKLQLKHPSVWNPEHAIACQAAYMAWLLEGFQGNVRRALAAYNFGIGNVKADRSWPEETIHYVKAIADEFEKLTTV
jgi:soluble lytic murein transglycosylase-like protein